MKANLVSSAWRVSGELSISQSSVIHHLHDLSKNIKSNQIVPPVTKILQNFQLTLVKRKVIVFYFKYIFEILFIVINALT